MNDYIMCWNDQTAWTHFTAGAISSDIESSLYQRVHAMLRELDTHAQAGSACNKGIRVIYTEL